jgi:hypothetical protein
MNHLRQRRTEDNSKSNVSNKIIEDVVQTKTIQKQRKYLKQD